MMRNHPTRMTGRTAATVMIGLVVWCGTTLLQSGQLVPYKGRIEGAVVIADEHITAPPARMISSHLGKGIQVYDETLEITATETSLRAEGISRSIAANGDELQIAFVLEGPLTGTETVPYVGWYHVLPGGTGRFAYDRSLLDLGQGKLTGEAVIAVDAAGVITLCFRHGFVGTLCLQPRRNKGISQ